MIIVLTAAVRKSPIINSIYYVENPSLLRLLCRKTSVKSHESVKNRIIYGGSFCWIYDVILVVLTSYMF